MQTNTESNSNLDKDPKEEIPLCHSFFENKNEANESFNLIPGEGKTWSFPFNHIMSMEIDYDHRTKEPNELGDQQILLTFPTYKALIEGDRLGQIYDSLDRRVTYVVEAINPRYRKCNLGQPWVGRIKVERIE